MESAKCYTDPYGVLGLDRTASKEEVKAAFRRLALKHHPDVDASPQAAARFTEVKRAADVILKGQHHAGASGAGPGPSSTRSAWRAYAESAADVRGDWRPRSRHTALWFCAAMFAGGCGIFYGALLTHKWFNGYDWQTPEQVEGRLHHPTLRRQQLLRLMMQERQQQRQQQQQQEQQQGDPS